MAFPPDNLSSEVGDNVGDYTISWGEVAGAEKYEFVEHCSRSVVPEAEIPWASGKVEVMPRGSTRKSIINKETGLYCWYRTRSCNTHGCGRYSKIFSFVVGAYPPSNVAISFPFNIGDADYNGAYQLTWDEPSQGSDKITGYEWRESSDGGDTWGNGRFVAANASRELDFSTQEFGETYSYQLRSCHPSPFPREPKVCGPWSAPEEIPVDVPTPSGLSTPGGTSYTGAYSVSWSSLGSGMSGIVDYQLSENDGASIPINGGGTVDRYSISGRAFQQTYSYRIRACVNPSSNRGQACSPWSSASTPIAVRLQVPSGLAMSDANGAGDSGVTNTSYDGVYQLSWSASVAGATRYEVREKAGSQPWSSVSSCTNTPCIITGKSAGSTTYKYAVRACLGTSGNEANCGDWTASGNVVSVSVPVLGSPSLNSDVTGGTSNSGNYSISRGNVTGAVSYQLQTRSKAKSATWSTWAPTDTTDITNFSSSSQSFPSQDYGQDYQYRAQACAGSNCSPWSTPTAVAVRLDALTSITMSDEAGVNDASVSGTSYDGTYQLSWSANITGADHYEWKESSNGGSTWSSSIDASCTDSTCSVSFTDKADDATYSYQVRACSARGNACGNWFSLNVSVPELSAPENVAIYDTTVGGDVISTSNGTYDVRWNAVSHAVSYKIEQKIDSGDWEPFASLSIDGAIGQRRVTPATVDYQKSYSYQVRACTGVNCSDWQETSDSIDLLFAPPENLEMSDAIGEGDSGVSNTSYDGDYQLSWSASSTGTTRYEVRETDSDGIESTVCDTTALTCDISGKAVGTSYSYGVRACLSGSGNANCGDWTVDANLVSVSIPGLDAPTAPQFASGVTTAISHSASYRLSWPSVIGAAAYKLQERKDSGGWTTIATQTSTQYEVSGRDYGHSYRYQVQTCASFDGTNANNCGDWSSSSDSVDITLPQLSNVTLPTSPISSSSAYTVSWTHPSSVGSGSYQIPASEVSYELEESTDTSFSGATTRMVPGDPNCQSVGGTGFECSFNPATKSGRTYYYRVKLLRSGSSSSWRASLGGVTVSWWPSVNLGRSEATDLDGSYNVTWSNPSSTYSLSLQEKVSGDIYQADGSATTTGGTWSNITSIVTTDGSRSFTGKAGHATYTYRARLCRTDDASICNGVWSGQSEVNLDVVLPSPTGLTIPDANNFTYGGDYTVEWNSGGAYSIATRTYTLKETLPGASPTAISVSNLNVDPTARYASGTYTYAVAACTSVGCTSYTTSASLDIADLSTPTLTDNGDQEYYNGQFELDWTQVFADAYTGTRRYQLQDGDGDDIVLSSSGATDHSFGSPPLGSGSYSYKVRACASTDTSKCSPWSSALYITVRDLDLSGLSLSSDDGHVSDDGSYTISWNGITEATSYVLLEDGIESCTPSGGITSCLLSGKSDGSSFDYKVRACAGPRCFESTAYTVAVNFETEISDCAGLNNVRDDLGSKYKLTADIDASCVTSPIGTDTTPFTGIFNGAGHTISNLTINLPSTNYVGLFGVIQGTAKIKNVGLIDVNITGGEYTGGLVGYVDQSRVTINNSYVTGEVNGQRFTGGLIGYSYGLDAIIANSYATVTVTGQSYYIGGLVGFSVSTNIINSYATGAVSGSDYVGGLVGENRYKTITNSYATGTVNATTETTHIGGFVGRNDDSAGARASINGTNYFVDSDGGVNGIGGDGSCSGTCTRKILSELATLPSVSSWTSTNWSFGTTSQLPALKYANDSDASDLECGGDTGVTCGELLPGQPITIPSEIAVNDCASLNNIRNNLSGNYKLTANISSASCVTSPIGTDTIPFTGTFNGAGYTISNLTINLPSTDHVGLFGVIRSGAKVMNVGLLDVNIRGARYVGGLVGNNDGSKIINSYATGTVSGNSSVGGLVGINNHNGSKITNSYATSQVSSPASGSLSHHTGGLVGTNLESGNIINSYATGTVSGNSSVGGLVGGGGESDGVVFGSITGTNYFVDSNGGSNGIGSAGSCSGTCSRKTLAELGQLTSTPGWTSTNWNFGESSQLPALKYVNDSDTSELECGGDTGVTCGQLLPGQPITIPGGSITVTISWTNFGEWCTKLEGQTIQNGGSPHSSGHICRFRDGTTVDVWYEDQKNHLVYPYFPKSSNACADGAAGGGVCRSSSPSYEPSGYATYVTQTHTYTYTR